MSSAIVAKLIVAASVLVSPIAASATETASSQPADASAPATAKPAAEQKKICKQLPSSSSRLPQRVCLTEKQWKQVDEDN